MYEEKDLQTENFQKADKDDNNKLIKNYNNSTPNNIHSVDETLQSNNAGIICSDATAKWTNVQTENSIENINWIVKPGQLVVIIGPVGAGKVCKN